ncbi:MFS transporter [Domibacillus indicus]|uniref:MFS transporter n=1 Tax=Domibacillus indicus TaxID=1437523 RepID=UPI0006182608|nr:MFS transporter [Domibacillus indicus]
MKKQPVLFLSLFLFFFHSSVALTATFLPSYFQEKGLSASEIGWLMAIGPFTALFSQPFWGYMSDKHKTVKRMVMICAGSLIIMSFFLFQAESFWMLLLIAAIFFSFQSPAGALGDSLSQKTAVLHHVQFGQIRMWGSVGFAVTSLLGGFILGQLGLGYLFYLYLIYAIFTFIVIQKISDVQASSKIINMKEAAKVVSRPEFLWFLLIIMLVTTTHRANDMFMGLYITELGGSASQIGLAWFIGVASEALLFMFSAYWIRLFKRNITFVIVAAGLYGLRWMLFALATEPIHLIMLQPLHGLTFGVFYLCTFQIVTKLMPDEFLATGQMVFISAFFGLSGIIGSLGGGWLIDRTGGAASMYQLLGWLAAAGCIGLIIYDRSGKKRKKKILRKTVSM